MRYNWQRADWPQFRYQEKEVQKDVLDFIQKIGRLGGMVESLDEKTRTETMLELMITEAITTSSIEGEYLSRKDVISDTNLN
ncbi:MAG: DUF4172 domain-containing protein [Bacteroidota bacterium]|nr:DUF4172 domain-containing protein [Bacteroidota bacterium]